MHAIRLLGQQLGKIWSQLGINQRVTIVMSGLVVLVALSGLVFWSSHPDYSLLFGRLDPTEAGRVISELEEMNVPHKIGAGGGSIYVPQNEVHRVRMQLATKGLPAASGVGFEIFDKPAFGMSDFVQQANYLRAIQGELARTIGEIEGVDSARVMVVKPESRLLIDPKKKTTASVFLKLRSSGAIDGTAVNAIRYLVASSVEGLKPDQVSVVDNAGNVLSEVGEEGSMHAMSSSQFAARQRVELYLQNKIRLLLEGFLGRGQVVVSVAAEINNETITKTAQYYPQEASVAKSTTKTTETTDSIVPKPGGVPGTPINTSVDTNSIASASQNNRTSREDSTDEFAVSLFTTNLVRTAGNIKRVTASVFVNTNDNPGITTQMKELQQAVANALGMEIPDGTEVQAADVAMSFVGFSTKEESEMKLQMDNDEKTELMWRVGKNGSYALLGLAALIGFWRLVKNSSEELLPTGIPVGQLIGGQLVYEAPTMAPGMAMSSGVIQGSPDRRIDEIMPEEEDVEELQAAKSKMVMDFGLGQQAPERITIEVLKQLIRENPAKMSQAARTWMARKARPDDNESYQ